MKIVSVVLAAALLISTSATRPAFADVLQGKNTSQSSQVQFISGGVSEEGMQEIAAQEANYNLKLMLVQDGQYLANVTVTITNDQGNTILQTTTEGPVLLAKMVPGQYSVSATTEKGETLTQQVKVNKDRLASYILRYPAKE